jgi:NAD(P)-dependent dehydrogenase (short-subunit alcohol dehydrogenase family)
MTEHSHHNVSPIDGWSVVERASELARAGATVLLGCRNQARAEAAAEAIRATGAPGPVEVLLLDLADLGSVRSAAAELVGSNRPLHLLINNAGLMALDRSITVDGFETQFGVNHLGHFALTADLLPSLLATRGSRIVTMSSMGHRAGRIRFDDLMHEHRYDRWTPYFQSKLANLLFTAELQRRLALGGHGTIALAAHPGASRTDLGTEGHGLTNKAMGLAVPVIIQSARAGAQPALRAATDPRARGGELYGPRWMLRGRAVRETPSRRARRADDAARLWTASEELTGRTVLPAIATTAAARATTDGGAAEP